MSDGGLSFVSGEPFSETTNPAFKASVMGLIDPVDTLILGANTYAQAKDYWPYADEQGEYGGTRIFEDQQDLEAGRGHLVRNGESPRVWRRPTAFPGARRRSRQHS